MKALNAFDIDLTPRLGEIEVPSLVLWGAHDGILPAALGEQAYAALRTPPSDKELVIFEDSAHSPFFEEPERFVDVVLTFIEDL